LAGDLAALVPSNAIANNPDMGAAACLAPYQVLMK